MNNLRILTAIIIGIIISIPLYYFPYTITGLILIVFGLIIFILAVYFTDKHNLPVGDFMGHPIKLMERWEKWKLGRILIFLVSIWAGIVISFVLIYWYNYFSYIL